ncbi:MAG: cyclic lactone autoinducer peptide [Bacteroidales bacterium]|nr:cyclic lactone autoinducer peptide [Bacteroidales bacterium]
MKQGLLKKMADIVLKTAKSAAGSASDWYVYQPKEPKMLKELKNK